MNILRVIIMYEFRKRTKIVDTINSICNTFTKLLYQFERVKNDT